jgi:hypothetical protein
MKNILCAVALLFLTVYANAQDAKRGITATEFASVKAVTFKNIEKDSYLKTGGLVFDRNDEKPPYVFKFSDGIERRIYLFNVFAAEGMKSVGTLAVFYTPKDGKMHKVCIPNSDADKAIWGQYIDDLKDAAKAADGFAVCLAFTLSKESSGPVKGGEQASADKDHNEFCFPADAHVLMADGTEKQIDQIKAGEIVAGLGNNTVKAVEAHKGQFSLTKVMVLPHAQVWASRVLASGLIELEGTANHPVLTLTGRKTIGTLAKGDIIFVEDAATQTYQMATVTVIQKESRVVNQVFNLVTEGGIYEVNNTLVLDK